LWASATAVVLGAAVALDAVPCSAGCPDSLEPLQTFKMASAASALAPIRVDRFHMVIVPFN
jgi:hypothetical protein